MEKINGKWIHDGREYEVVAGICLQCYFYKKTACVCGFANSCQSKIGLDNYFKLKEPKMKKEELNFKVLTPTEGRAAFILRALDEIGIIRARRIPYDVIKAVRVMNGEAVIWTKPFDSLNSFDASLAPEVTLEQALELLKRVEPVAPEFDIKPFDRVLIKDMGNQWSANLFNKLCNNNEFDLVACQATKMIKYESNEHFLGMYDMPAGWWECCEGKPVWRSK